MKFNTVRKFALSLGDVTEEPHHHFNSFRYKGKIFVTVPPGEEHIHVFPSENDRERALAMYPEFMEKLLWGGKVVGVRVCVDKASVGPVKALLLAAYEYRAAKATVTTDNRGPRPGKR